jgi:hypothetical protein
MSAGVFFRRAGRSLLPMMIALAACEQPNATAPDAPDASFAKGSQTALKFRWSDAGSVRSDEAREYVDGQDVGSLPVNAYISIGQGRNAYLVTYHSTREICLDFPDTPVVQSVIASGDFPGRSFCPQFDVFMANGVSFTSMQIPPAGAQDPWNYASYPSVELEFYPKGGTSGPTYQLHFSSLSMVRTASGTWQAATHEQTVTQLRVVRRKSNTVLGTVNMPTSFTMMLK